MQRTSQGTSALLLGVLLVIILIAGLNLLSGCIDHGLGMRWAPTEAQKQAADLTVRDVVALKPHVPKVAEPIRAEAEKTARITQAYAGLPETPLAPAVASEVPVVDPAKEQALEDAEQDAKRPPPTIENVVDAGFSLAEVILGTLGSVAGIGGLGKLGQVALKARNGLKAQRSAVDELVETIESLKSLAVASAVRPGGSVSADEVSTVLAGQSFDTQKIVSKARLNAGRRQGA